MNEEASVLVEVLTDILSASFGTKNINRGLVLCSDPDIFLAQPTGPPGRTITAPSVVVTSRWHMRVGHHVPEGAQMEAVEHYKRMKNMLDLKVIIMTVSTA